MCTQKINTPNIVYEVEDRKLYKKALRFCSIMNCAIVMLM